MMGTKITMNFLSGLRKSNDAQLEPAHDLTRDVTIEIISEITEVRYILYKRRWYGVLIWVLINRMASWAVRYFASIFHVRARFSD